jgi:hypothetical protein
VQRELDTIRPARSAGEALSPANEEKDAIEAGLVPGRMLQRLEKRFGSNGMV